MMAFGGLLLALGLAFFILPGPGTSHAQPPVDITIKSLVMEIDADCHATVMRLPCLIGMVPNSIRETGS